MYAGINEEIKQIQSGACAPDDAPIQLNQNMMYMDEEVGDPTHGGIAYENIDMFYDWLLGKNKHLKCFNLVYKYLNYIYNIEI